MAKGDDEARRRARTLDPWREKHEHAVKLLRELYDLIDPVERHANRAGPAAMVARDRRRTRFVAGALDVCRALALGVRGR